MTDKRALSCRSLRALLAVGLCVSSSRLASLWLLLLINCFSISKPNSGKLSREFSHLKATINNHKNWHFSLLSLEHGVSVQIPASVWRVSLNYEKRLSRLLFNLFSSLSWRLRKEKFLIFFCLSFFTKESKNVRRRKPRVAWRRRMREQERGKMKNKERISGKCQHCIREKTQVKFKNFFQLDFFHA